MSESIQDKLKRVRPPRVQITYDVEAGDAIEKKELPFIMGILADLSGKQTNLPYLKDRKFVEIDRDNFNGVMASIKPRVAFQVKDRLSDGEEDNQLNVELEFHHLDDFHPAQIVKQIDPLRQLYEARQKLNDLVAKLDGNDDLDSLLQEVATNTDQQQQIQQETKGGEE